MFCIKFWFKLTNRQLAMFVTRIQLNFISQSQWISPVESSENAKLKQKDAFVLIWFELIVFLGCRLARKIPSDRDLQQSCCQNSHLMHLYQLKINRRMRAIENGQFWPGAELLSGHFAPQKLICNGRVCTGKWNGSFVLWPTRFRGLFKWKHAF